MKQYSIKFIGRNAYISDADGRSSPILSIDFKSVQPNRPNGTTLVVADHCQYSDTKYQDITGRHPVFQPGQRCQIILPNTIKSKPMATMRS